MATINDEAIVKRGISDGQGNPMMDIEFSGCIGYVYGTSVSDSEVNLFKQGVLAERERIWNKLADILNGKEMTKVSKSKLFDV